MRTLEDIINRRSIRTFCKDQITDEQLTIILNAGKLAPSARNSQPWHFTVIQNKELQDWIVNRNKKIMQEKGEVNPRMNDANYHNFYHAPTVIIVSGEASNPYHACDCGMATQNIALAAWSLKIGSIVVASVRFAFGDPEFRSKINLPSKFIPLYAIALGYIDGELPTTPSRKTEDVFFIK